MWKAAVLFVTGDKISSFHISRICICLFFASQYIPKLCESYCTADVISYFELQRKLKFLFSNKHSELLIYCAQVDAVHAR